MEGELPKDLFKHVHVQIATKKTSQGGEEGCYRKSSKKVLKRGGGGRGGGGGWGEEGRLLHLAKSVDYIGVVAPRGRGGEEPIDFQHILCWLLSSILYSVMPKVEMGSPRSHVAWETF